MENITIEKLWSDFEKYGFEVRSKSKLGNDAWQVVKKNFSDCAFSEWNEPSVSYYQTMKGLHLYGDTIDKDGNEVNDNDDHSIWEPHHFMIQHGRIVNNNKPSLMRLAQIAYNAGQLRAERSKNGDEAYSTEQIAYYDNPKTGTTNIRSYITAEDQQMLERIINTEPSYAQMQLVFRILEKVDELPSKLQQQSLHGGYALSSNLYIRNKSYYNKLL